MNASAVEASSEHSLPVLTLASWPGQATERDTLVLTVTTGKQITSGPSGSQEAPPMLGSTSSSAALPSIFLADSTDHRMVDEDYLPAWSKSMSTSPRLAPVEAGASGSNAAGSPAAFAAVSHTNGTGATRNVGIGLSPVLSPTHLSDAGLDMVQSADTLSRAAFGGNGASSFASSFSKFQEKSPEFAAIRKSPISRRQTLATEVSAPLSFANVASLSAASPSASPSMSRASSSVTGTQTGASRHRAASSKQHALGTADFAGALPDGLQKRTTSGDAAMSSDEPRIQAFAKLEFPSFDIYIQKLSITIGRRPVTPRASTSASAGPSVPLSLEEAQKAGISLEEYILNLDPSALSGAEPSATPASVKGKGKAVDGPLAEYLIASPPPPAASTVTNGPRTSISNTSRTPSAPSTPHPPASPFTDVDLGPLRAVSRQHARLYFDFDAGAWTIEVLGRNGIVIEGKWRGKGQKVVLTKKTRIQIAERIFHFVLPTIDVVTVEPSVAVEAISGPAQSEKQAVGTSKGKAKASAAGTNTDLGTTTTRPMVPEGLVSVEPGPERATSSASTKSNGLELLTESASADSAPVSASLPPPPLSSTPKPFTASSSRAVPAAPLSRPPPPGKMPVTSAASSRASAASARATLLPTPTAASNRPVRNTAKKPPPHAPKAASSAARASSLGLVSRAVSEEMDDASIEAARQRAAVIAQLLSGDAGAAASSKNSLVRAAAKAKRAGKGKAPMRMAGKGPGKGKGLMPPPRRPSDLGWSDDEDDDLFASSAEDDSHDDDEETSPMDVEVVAAGQGGGKAVVQRSASASSASASPAPPQPVPSKAPRKAGKMPAKQPRRRRDVPVSAQPVATASPAPSTTEASPRASSPTLPSTLPALPNLSPSPAVDSPVSLPALNLLPPLPALKPSPSPAVAAAPLPPTSSAAPTTSNSQPTPSPAPVPASAKKAKPSKKGKTEGTSAPAEAANPEASSAAAKSNAATSASGQSDAAAPAKPRPSPYAPAPLPPGVPPPDAAPADNRTAKPPYTYASLIAQAINSSPAKKLTLHEIYDWVTDKWPYFLGNQKGWQNSIRHNLTPARGFLKIVREKDDAGKGSFWEIDPTQMSNFDGHHYRKKPDGPTGGTASNKAKADAAAKAAAAATAQITAAASQAPPTSATASTSKSDAKPSAPRASAPSNAPLSKPLPVIVAPIPDSYVRPSTPSDGSQPTDELTAALLADPPIVLHESKLVLNPTIFSSLSDAELGELQKQPASAALQTLQAKVVQHFKDKMRNKSVQKLTAAAKAAASSSNSKPPAASSPKASTASLPSLPPLPAKAPPAQKAVVAKAPRAGLAAVKAPRSAAAPKASKAPKASSSASTGKRGREPDVDLTATAPAKPAKVAKKKK